MAWSGTETFSHANPEDTFSGFGIMTFEKSELNSAYGPYHISNSSIPNLSKGTPNCPKTTN